MNNNMTITAMIKNNFYNGNDLLLEETFKTWLYSRKIQLEAKGNLQIKRN